MKKRTFVIKVLQYVFFLLYVSFLDIFIATYMSYFYNISHVCDKMIVGDNRWSIDIRKIRFLEKN